MIKFKSVRPRERERERERDDKSGAKKEAIILPPRSLLSRAERRQQHLSSLIRAWRKNGTRFFSVKNAGNGRRGRFLCTCRGNILGDISRQQWRLLTTSVYDAVVDYRPVSLAIDRARGDFPLGKIKGGRRRRIQRTLARQQRGRRTDDGGGIGIRRFRLRPFARLPT